jgi:RNA polymerase sigma factor (sigma-70 family)
MDPRQLWYAPDRRLRTEAASEAAMSVFEWVTGSRPQESEPDEDALFVALHTCAYRAARRARGKAIKNSERITWMERWRAIREFIVERNLGLVYSMIKRFGSRRLDEDDLLSDAMYGLTRAVDRFNPWKGYRFSTYACNVIARALMRRGKRESNYRRLFPVQHDATFERPDHLPDADSELYVERLQIALDGNLGELTDLEYKILAQRFPERHREKLTFQEIGDTVGLSKERVRQIQNIALRKLREVLDEDMALQ